MYSHILHKEKIPFFALKCHEISSSRAPFIGNPFLYGFSTKPTDYAI
jgi:hypothetical protein